MRDTVTEYTFTDVMTNKYNNFSHEGSKALFKYLEQLEELYKKERDLNDQAEKVEKDGFFLSKNLINKESKRKCPVCDIYSFKVKDDLYMNKFKCCWKCYIQWVEGREERWEKGWRPKNEIDEKRKEN